MECNSVLMMLFDTKCSLISCLRFWVLFWPGSDLVHFKTLPGSDLSLFRLLHITTTHHLYTQQLKYSFQWLGSSEGRFCLCSAAAHPLCSWPRMACTPRLTDH